MVWLHAGCAIEVDGLALAELLERWTEPLRGEADWLEQVRQTYTLPLPDGSRITASIGRPEACLPALQKLWWATREPRVARQIERLSALDPDDPIRRLARAKKLDLRVALETGIATDPDSRWVDLVLPWLDTPPFSNALEIWHAALALLDRHADPRCLETIQIRSQDTPADLMERFGRQAGLSIHHWLTTRSRHGFPHVTAPSHTLPPAVTPVLDAVDTWLDTLAEAHTPRGELLHAAAGGDRDALMVYADVLCTESDPRGEFIQLEQISRRTPEQRARRDELKKQWRLLVGDLAPVALRDGLAFQHGLPVTLAAHPPPPLDLDRVLGSVDWASVRHLEIRRNPQRRAEPQLALALHARRLSSIRLPDLEVFLHLLSSDGSNAAVHEVIVDAAAEGSWMRHPLSLRALPNLRSLTILHHAHRHTHVLAALQRSLPEVTIL